MPFSASTKQIDREGGGGASLCRVRAGNGCGIRAHLHVRDGGTVRLCWRRDVRGGCYEHKLWCVLSNKATATFRPCALPSVAREDFNRRQGS